jgi:hypothetical protein
MSNKPYKGFSRNGLKHLPTRAAGALFFAGATRIILSGQKKISTRS